MDLELHTVVLCNVMVKKFFNKTKMLSKHFTHNFIFKYHIIILASKLLMFSELILQSSVKL